ncbi:hypothetical protein BGZ46_004382 [Entomortierella lignicola]|nr:hypothetical protein BGZ46_004382 [Entomortierella lignicola]
MVMKAKIQTSRKRSDHGSSLINKSHGAVALSRALKTNTTLTILKLGRNSIGNLDLSEVLKTNISLITLNISNDSIEYKGAIIFLGALKVNTMLITLNFRYRG